MDRERESKEDIVRGKVRRRRDGSRARTRLMCSPKTISTKGCGGGNQSKIVLYQACWVHCVNGTGAILPVNEVTEMISELSF